MPLPDSATPSSPPTLDPAAPLHFVVNAGAGHEDAQARRQAIEAVLLAAGRAWVWHACGPGELERVAGEAAAQALACHGAVVAVGGDGTINTVAQAAHASGCAMGVVPQGTFNYFARTHGIPADLTEATALLLQVQPVPVQVAAVNERVFLVNASLGLYPDLLEDREAYKARWGRSRWVAFWAGCATLLRAQRRLRLRIELGGQKREVRALTLFVGNNRLQLEQLGVLPTALAGGRAGGPGGASHAAGAARAAGAAGAAGTMGVAVAPHAAPIPQAPVVSGTAGEGSITAVMLRPVGLLTMLSLMLRGALGTLGEADDVEGFSFTRMLVRPALLPGRRRVKVAFDGEVDRMRPPLHFRVLPRPLYLLKEPPAGASPMAGTGACT